MLTLKRRGTEQEAESIDGRLRLQGEVTWVLEGAASEIQGVAAALGPLCERLSDELALIQFGTAVGLFELTGLGTVEVVSGKWGQADFDQMLRELTEIASALPFAALTTAALPYERQIMSEPDLLYHAFIYLRYALSTSAPPEEQLARALTTVLADPHRRFDRVSRQVPLFQASRVGAATLEEVASGRGGLGRVRHPTARQMPLAQALHGYLPLEVRETAVRTTIDTAENRFVKSVIGGAMRLIAAMRDVAVREGNPAFTSRVLADCIAMEQKLTPFVRSSFWNDVGPMVHLPGGSPVLQSRRGYQDVYRHFVRLRLASRVPLSKDVIRDLLHAKDIAQLYEIWCFFRVVRQLEGFLGAPHEAERLEPSPLQLTVPWDLRVSWNDGRSVFYNCRFSRSRPETRRSYSVPLRPDIVLELPAGPNAGLHLLDAKFRVDKLEAIMPLASGDAEAEAEVLEEERRGTFKRGDLYKMHTYRDAIPRARSVWILYPGSDYRHFSAHVGAANVGSGGAGPVLTGVGGIPLMPGEAGASYLGRFLGDLLGMPQP